MSFKWAEEELRPPMSHERPTPRAAAEVPSVLVDPHGRPVGNASPPSADDLALRPSKALLMCVQIGLRMGAMEVVRRMVKGKSRA